MGDYQQRQNRYNSSLSQRGPAISNLQLQNKIDPVPTGNGFTPVIGSQLQIYYNKGEENDKKDPSFDKGPQTLNRPRKMNKVMKERGGRHFHEDYSQKKYHASIDEQNREKSENKRRSLSIRQLPLLNQKIESSKDVPFLNIPVPLSNNLKAIAPIPLKQNDAFKIELVNPPKSEQCQAAKKNPLKSEVDEFINSNDIYYNHMKGLCLCYKCSCNNCKNHKCDYIKNSHLKQPFSQPLQHSNYALNYIPKQNQQALRFNQGIYENLKSNMNPIDSKSTNQQDFMAPEQRFYGANPNFKPVQHYEANSFQVGKSHYRRDFLEWGCTPILSFKAESQRTTIDAMPFRGLSTYSKDFHQVNTQRVKLEKNNRQTTISKSPIPFLGVTTSQEFFRPYKKCERVAKIKLSDELILGAPSYKGQYSSMNTKDFIKPVNICDSQKETVI